MTFAAEGSVASTGTPAVITVEALIASLSFLLVCGCADFVPRETTIEPAMAELDLGFIRAPLSPGGIPVLCQGDAEHGGSRFILDTGSESTTISERYATRMGFPSRWTVPYWIVGAENEREWVERVVRVHELRFQTSRRPGRVGFREFDALVAHTPLFDHGIDGILGAPLFADCTFTIDFAANVLRIEEGSIDGSLPHTIPIHVARGGLIYVDIELAGESRRALLDTGSSASLSVPEEHWDDLPLKDWNLEGQAEGFSFGGIYRRRFGQLSGCVVIAGQTIQDPFVTSKPGVTVTIGSGLLNGYALSIDQRGRLARLVRSPPNAPTKLPATTQ
jgi:hypothetical protein